MKKISSISSTKPEQFLYTDFSIVPPTNNYRVSINKIVNYIQSVILKYRQSPYIAPRDANQLYQLDPTFFNAIFNITSGQQLWAKMSTKNKNKNEEDDEKGLEYNKRKSNDRGGQREIVSLFTKIIIALTNEKNACAQNKNINRFAQIKTLIQWLEEKLVIIEKQVREKKKEFNLKKREVVRAIHEQEYKEYENYLSDQMESKKQNLEETISKKHHEEKTVFNTLADSQARGQYYIFRGSKQLRDAKDISLLAKLAPYKSEKKRPYEHRVLQDSLDQMADFARSKMIKKIDDFKKNQMRKLARRQNIEKQHKFFKMQEQRQQVMRNAENKIDERRKSDKIQIQKLIQSNNKQTNQRISSLKKSLNRYTIHDQSRKIRQIIHNHRETVQFVHDIDKINRTERHSDLNIYDTKQSISPKYQTLNPQEQWGMLKDRIRYKKSQSRYTDKKSELKILRKLKKEEVDSDEQVYNERSVSNSHRKSLIDLYDSSLNEVSLLKSIAQ